MTVSIWRYSHWILALITSVFILIASVTGIILAIEPISNQMKPYAVRGSSDLTVAELVSILNKEFDEVVSIEVDKNNFLKASVFTREGENKTFYLDPITGRKLDDAFKRAPVYDFATNLHRSLFLKSTGRFIIGLVSFLLILIVISGIFLIAKRQGGFKRWFAKVIKEDYNQYYHVVLGRFALTPLLIVAVSGVLLSMYRFEILPVSNDQITNYKTVSNLKKKSLSDFEIFNTHFVNDLVKLEYPFSDDEEDYFVLTLKGSEYNINQYTGQVLMSGKTSLLSQLLHWSFVLHTGQGSLLWPIVLLLSCIALLFFMYSGFAMSWQRLSSRSIWSNKYTENEAECIVLVGSETGSTQRFAEEFSKSLLNNGVKVFIDKMNNYTTYKNATDLILMTSTYGEGDAPSSASNFYKKFKRVQQPNRLSYSVLGFGSLMYPEYCKYADTVDRLIRKHSTFDRAMPIFKINNQSEAAFKEWLSRWSKIKGLELKVTSQILPSKKGRLSFYVVAHRSQLNTDQTFTIRLKQRGRQKFQSGDLLALYPDKEGAERLYSIGKIDGDILLSIRKHDLGLASNMLYDLCMNQILKAKIKRNYEFHFPFHTSEVIMISNGTGIAPFLGMLSENKKQVPCHLFWGVRNKESLKLYASYIEKVQQSKRLSDFQVAYSRSDGPKTYVQDLIPKHKSLFKKVLSGGGVIMVCGSIAMQNQVISQLNHLTKAELNKPLSFFEANEQLKMDCY
jgi:sulfite reductase (NADPH) flavoprotein alpha-component